MVLLFRPLGFHSSWGATVARPKANVTQERRNVLLKYAAKWARDLQPFNLDAQYPYSVRFPYKPRLQQKRAPFLILGYWATSNYATTDSSTSRTSLEVHGIQEPNHNCTLKLPIITLLGCFRGLSVAHNYSYNWLRSTLNLQL